MYRAEITFNDGEVITYEDVEHYIEDNKFYIFEMITDNSIKYDLTQVRINIDSIKIIEIFRINPDGIINLEED